MVDIDQTKLSKLKKFLALAVIITLIIIGWHFYSQYFLQEKPEDSTEHDILQLSQKLFADEIKQHPYLAAVHFQGKTRPNDHGDRAPELLLEVSDAVLTADPQSTTSLMKHLFDNYELDTHVIELVTAEEKKEELDFLHAVLNTPVMKRTMKFLQQNGAVGNYESQVQLLQDIWFLQYSRGQGRIGSSGFEHVFMAELKDGNILGLHNWIYFSEQERNGQLDYKGFIDRLDLDKNHKHLLATRFTFNGITKKYNTLFIGTSPELEMSLYTVCFVLHRGLPCPVQLGSAKFDIITYDWDWHGKKTLASAYPEIKK